MADEFERLRTLWSVQSFRRTVAQLAQLSSEQLNQLRARTDGGFELDDADQVVPDVSPADSVQLVAALSELYEPRLRGTTPDQVLDELQGLAKRESRDLPHDFSEILARQRPALLTLLSPRPEYDRTNWREITQRSGLPALEDVSLFVDLRVTTLGGQGSQLVPVVVARLEFDEPISSAGLSIAFQVPDSALTVLREALERLQVAVDEMNTTFGDHML